MADSQDVPLSSTISKPPENTQRYSVGTTTKSPQEDIDAISNSLSARRRLSLRTILHSYKSQNTLNKGKSRANEEAVVEDEEDISAEEEAEEEEITEETQRINTEDLKKYEEYKGERINIQKNTPQGILKNHINVEDEIQIDYEKEYVWDVLFENQRGIWIFGKGYFSSSSLLPADPSAFTRPSNNIPSASSLSKKKSKFNSGAQTSLDSGASSGIGSGESSSNPTPTTTTGNKGKSERSKRSNKTSYTLESYQPPLPEWQYITPWMINMRTGTDELGWRYNAWFKKKGWSSHSGNLGWWGWVRRREWIRLRSIGTDPNQIGGQKPNELITKELEEREKLEKKGDRLKDVLTAKDDVKQNVLEILTVMGKISLDRQRLELWKKWLEHENKTNNRNGIYWTRLEQICNDEQAESVITVSAGFGWIIEF
ncbi:uncharacterized protein L201_004192 [Kwoniella dendrophila CBS 6074]|uniref:Peroxin domain-containing protein n=1 Tax=Kwoniella dendrophila CBS 6074 TaxID=1295534 RepID=A0AAX4JVJ1_9TREE